MSVDCLKILSREKNPIGDNQEQSGSHNWQIKAVEPMVRSLPEK
jgi:hypothetical protein